MITVVVGKEIEKLKGEFESVINGMNMVGEIPYNVYSELFDVGTDCIQKAYELGKSELENENAELKETFKTYNGCGDWDNDFHTCRVYLQREELQECTEQLTKAKKIIKQFLNDYPIITKDLLDKLEQFISEVENDKQED